MEHVKYLRTPLGVQAAAFMDVPTREDGTVPQMLLEFTQRNLEIALERVLAPDGAVPIEGTWEFHCAMPEPLREEYARRHRMLPFGMRVRARLPAAPGGDTL